MKDKFFKELDKCKSRLEVYDFINNYNHGHLYYHALQHEFFNLMTYEVPELINALKEKYEFIENNF